MTVTYDAMTEHVSWTPTYRTAGEDTLTTVGRAFEALSDLRLLISTGQRIAAWGAVHTLMIQVRWDSPSGHEVGTAAERYADGTAPWDAVRRAFARWAAARLAEVT